MIASSLDVISCTQIQNFLLLICHAAIVHVASPFVLGHIAARRTKEFGTGSLLAPLGERENK